MKILVVFGTRPEAIKMCPLVQELKKNQKIECLVCLTGQHKEMLIQVMDVFGIKEDYNLNIMKENQSLSTITTVILNKLEEIIEKDKPDLVLVHGDTTTSFAASLSAFYHNVPIGHVEAGLRTFNLQSPYPEEFNRQAIDLVSELYFAPTEQAQQQLLKEGKNPQKVFVTGNTVIDALHTTIGKNFDNEDIAWSNGSRLLLVTAHRRENIGQPMRNMFRALKRIIEEFPDVKIIYPIHKNPKVRDIAAEILEGIDRIRLIEPLDVCVFHNLISKSYLVLTDSGGIQEEAPALGKPVLVMRDTTERPEGVEAGTLRLVGVQEDTIYAETKKLLVHPAEYEKMSKAVNPYGDGHASQKIVEIILDTFVRR